MNERCIQWCSFRDIFWCGATLHLKTTNSNIKQFSEYVHFFPPLFLYTIPNLTVAATAAATNFFWSCTFSAVHSLPNNNPTCHLGSSQNNFLPRLTLCNYLNSLPKLQALSFMAVRFFVCRRLLFAAADYRDRICATKNNLVKSNVELITSSQLGALANLQRAYLYKDLHFISVPKLIYAFQKLNFIWITNFWKTDDFKSIEFSLIDSNKSGCTIVEQATRKLMEKVLAFTAFCTQYLRIERR